MEDAVLRGPAHDMSPQDSPEIQPAMYELVPTPDADSLSEEETETVAVEDGNRDSSPLPPLRQLLSQKSKTRTPSAVAGGDSGPDSDVSVVFGEYRRYYFYVPTTYYLVRPFFQ